METSDPTEAGGLTSFMPTTEDSLCLQGQLKAANADGG